MATTESTSNAVPATPGPASSPAPAQPPMGGLTGDFTWTTEVDRRRGLIGLLMMHGQGNHLQITPQGWQGLFDASAPFGYRLIGAIEFHQADAAQPWDQHHMGRLARQARTRDVVLHYVDGSGEHVEIAWGGRGLARRRRLDIRRLASQGRRPLSQHAADDLNRDARRHGCGGRLRLGEAPPQEFTVEVDRNDHIRPEGPADRDGDWVAQAAVEKPLALHLGWTEDSGQRDRGANGLMDRPGLQPDLAAGRHVSGDGGVLRGVALDGLADAQLLQESDHLTAADKAASRQAEIHQPAELAPRHRFRPLPQLGQPAGDMGRADQRAY